MWSAALGVLARRCKALGVKSCAVVFLHPSFSCSDFGEMQAKLVFIGIISLKSGQFLVDSVLGRLSWIA